MGPDLEAVDLIFNILLDFSGQYQMDELGACSEDIHMLAPKFSKELIETVFHFIKQELPDHIHILRDEACGVCAYVPAAFVDSAESFLASGGFTARAQKKG